MDFKPCDTYEMLLKQATALARLNTSLESQLSYYTAKDYSLSIKKLEQLEQSLESERNMNRILTDELAKLSGNE